MKGDCKIQEKDFWCALLEDKLDLTEWGTSRRTELPGK
jgi:hypothetical protein